MRTRERGKVYCFSREPGGAEAVGLTLKGLKGQTDSPYILIGKDYACDVFDSHGLSYKSYDGTSREQLYAFLDSLQKEVSADAVLTSASSIPEQDMTEKYLWKWAETKKVASIAILDQWQNYKERFSGPNGTQLRKFLPDVICVMDESARRGMLVDGIPEKRITVTGHPSLSRLRRIMIQPDMKEIADVRKKLELSDTQKLILFVSEPFSRYYGDEMGFTEWTILKELLLYFQRRFELSDKADNNIRLVIKLHPKNSIDHFEQLTRDFAEVWKKQTPIVITHEINKIPLLLASDLVIGMASIMLMESIALGRPTVSIQLGAKITNLCEAVNQEILPFISTNEEMCQLLDRLLDDPTYKEQYTKAIKNYPIIQDADKRIWELVESRRLQ